MTTFAVSMVKNEIDVIEGCLRHMAGEVDHMIVADNGSTDGTREVLDQLTSEIPLTVIDDPEVAYEQSEKMTRLAAMAGEAGAVRIVPFDADELWFSEQGRISDVLALATGNVFPAKIFNHYATAVDPGWKPEANTRLRWLRKRPEQTPDPFATMGWRSPEPGGLPKVAFAWRPGSIIHQGNHGVDIPGKRVDDPGLVEVRHFPYRSAEQFLNKSIQGAAAYRALDEKRRAQGKPVNKDQGAHWRLYDEARQRHGDDAVRDHYRRNFWHFAPLDAGLIYDPAPYRHHEQ
jgi:hypothetical protein